LRRQPPRLILLGGRAAAAASALAADAQFVRPPMTNFAYLGILTGVLACAPRAANAPPAPAQAWAGCYALTRGPWDSQPEPFLQQMPAPTLQLRLKLAGPETFYAGPRIPEDRPTYRAMQGTRKGFWWLVSQDSIVVSQEGVAGVALYLRRVSDSTASGMAVTFNDIVVHANPGDPDAEVDTLADGTIRVRDFKRWVTRASLSARARPC